MAIDLKALCCTLLVLCTLHEGVQAKRRRPGSDLLLASMQDSISLLTELTTYQTTKITSTITKLDEARAEIEQLKSELSNSQSKVAQLEEKQVELTDAASSLRNESKAGMEELKSELSTTLEKVDSLVEKQVELTDAASSLKNESKAGMEELKSELSTTLGKVDSLEEKQVEYKNESTTEVEGLKNELSTKMSSLEEAQGELKATVAAVKTNVTSDIDDLTAKVEEIAWPEGSYCILSKGGSCPAGFTRYQGWANYIYTYRNSGGYTQAVTFGDSYISCRTGCGYSSTGHNVNLRITSCCK